MKYDTKQLQVSIESQVSHESCKYLLYIVIMSIDNCDYWCCVISCFIYVYFIAVIYCTVQIHLTETID